MKYINAEDIFPPELLKEIQEYIRGGIVYVPKPEGSFKKWGENSGSRMVLKRRNEEIRQRFSDGVTIEQLSDQFCLSFDSIKKSCIQKNNLPGARRMKSGVPFCRYCEIPVCKIRFKSFAAYTDRSPVPHNECR